MENLELWNKVKQVPKEYLKEIKAGRLRGKSDINPQWRYQAMTEQFGPIGIGWKYEVVKVWTEPGPANQVFCFAEIALYFKRDEVNDKWSDPIPGIGGHMLVVQESSGLHANDEGYKMAITDALSVAMKMLGFGADVYAGLWDGSKYRDSTKPPTQKQNKPTTTTTTTEPPKNASGDVPQGGVTVKNPGDPVTEPQLKALNTILNNMGVSDTFERHKEVALALGLKEVPTSLIKLTKGQASEAISKLGAKKSGDLQGGIGN